MLINGTGMPALKDNVFKYKHIISMEREGNSSGSTGVHVMMTIWSNDALILIILRRPTNATKVTRLNKRASF